MSSYLLNKKEESKQTQQSKGLNSSLFKKGQQSKNNFLSDSSSNKGKQSKSRNFLSCPFSKKGQLQMGETMMVILIIMFIGAISFIFIFRMQLNKIELDIDKEEDMSALETAQFVSNLYELRCSKSGMETTCIDLDKARALAELIASDDTAKNYYSDLIGPARIRVREIYPVSSNLTIYEVNATENGKRQEKISFFIPVTVYDSVNRKSNFGILEIYRYKKPTANT